MTQSPPSRHTSTLSESLLRQLNLYVLGGTAAGVGAMALIPPAEAKIVYTPANILITYTPLDLNHDGINDFVLLTESYGRYSAANAVLLVQGFNYDSPNQIRGQSSLASAFHAGVRMGNGAQHFSQLSTRMARWAVNSRNHRSYFAWPWADGGKGVKNRYLGFKFVIDGKYHYGWARLNVFPARQQGWRATLTGYAYETIPGKSIITGDTKGKSAVTARQGNLGHLARGSAVSSR